MAVETLKTVITADNKQALSALKEFAAAGDTVTKSVDSVDRQLQKLQNQLKNLNLQKEVAGAITPLGEINSKIELISAKIKSLGGAVPSIGESFKKVGTDVEESASKTTNGLTKAYSTLRQIAYVLPGIGIAGIFNFGFEAIGKAAQAMGVFSKKASEAEKNLKNLEDVQKEGNKQAGEELTKAKILYSATQDVNLSMRERVKAAQELKNIYPELLKNFSNETIAAGGAKKAYDELTNSIVSNARAKAAANKIGELQAKILDAEFQKKKITNALSNELQNSKTTTDTDLEGITTTTTALQKQHGAFIRANKGWADQNKLIKEYTQEQQFLESVIGKSALERGVIGEGKTKGLDSTSKKLSAYQELEKELQKITSNYASGGITNEKYNEEAIAAIQKYIDTLKRGSAAWQEMIDKRNEFLRPRKEREDLATPATEPLSKQEIKDMKSDTPKHLTADGKNGSGVFDADISKQAEENNKKLQQYNENLKLSNQLADAGANAFGTLFSTMLEGKDVGAVLGDVFKQLAVDIAKAVVKALLFKMIMNVLNIATGVVTGGASLVAQGVGSAVGAYAGSKGFAQGGVASGPTSGYLALLHGTEHIMRPDQLTKIISGSAQMGAMQSVNTGATNERLVADIQGNKFLLWLQRSDFSRGLQS